jgi:hypothetical protein
MNQDLDHTLRTYADHVESYTNQSSQWKEVDVKRYLIEPLLSALLWDPANPRFVRHEFPVTMGSGTRSADYALMSGSNPVCIVEAKSEKPEETAAKQVLSYARVLNVPWALVTDGRTLRLYGSEFYKGENVTNAMIMDVRISLDNLDAAIKSLRYLTRGTLDSKEVYDAFKKFNARLALVGFLQSNKGNLIKVITKWVEENWAKGPVDVEDLSASLDTIFSSAERIAQKAQVAMPAAAPTPRGTLRTTVAGDWNYRPDLGQGIFELKTDSERHIDVSMSGPDVEHQLIKLGLRVSSTSAFGGFYYMLRRQAGLIRNRG